MLSIALMDDVTPAIGRGERWKDYRSHSRSSLPMRNTNVCHVVDLFRTALLKKGWWPLIHGDHASWLVELAKRAPLPEGLDTGAIDLIHANHFS